MLTKDPKMLVVILLVRFPVKVCTLWKQNIMGDAINLNFPSDEQMRRCEKNAIYWREIMTHRDPTSASEASVHSALDVVFEEIDNNYPANQECDILVTGSLHLIGAALTALKMESQVLTPE